MNAYARRLARRLGVLAAGALVVLAAGCASLVEDGSVYYLDAEPMNNQCRTQRCQTLDDLTARLYAAARSGRIKWVQLVDIYYSTRDKTPPVTGDTPLSAEIKAYQRVLAEQMDAKRITESQWVFLQRKRIGELEARETMLQNSAPRTQSCTTTNTGTAAFPNWQTTCR